MVVTYNTDYVTVQTYSHMYDKTEIRNKQWLGVKDKTMHDLKRNQSQT